MGSSNFKNILNESEEFLIRTVESVTKKADAFLRNLDEKGLGRQVQHGKEFVEESVESTRDFVEERIEKTSEAAREAFEDTKEFVNELGVVQTLRKKLDAVLEAIPELLHMPSQEEIKGLREEIKNLKQKLDEINRNPSDEVS